MLPGMRMRQPAGGTFACVPSACAMQQLPDCGLPVNAHHHQVRHCKSFGAEGRDVYQGRRKVGLRQRAANLRRAGVCVYIYVYMCVYMFVCMFLYSWTYVHVCMPLAVPDTVNSRDFWVATLRCSLASSRCVCICVCVCMCVFECLGVCMFSPTPVYVRYAYMYVYVCAGYLGGIVQIVCLWHSLLKVYVCVYVYV